MLIAENVLGGKLCILRKGKKSYTTARAAGGVSLLRIFSIHNHNVITTKEKIILHALLE